ncbi:MAG: hypothetical protein GX488_01650, partial [Clostridiales bacterium]|nr:hypothetical protein [Clostridiales bacterium]
TRMAALGAWLSRSSRSSNRSSKLKILGICLLMAYAYFAFMFMLAAYFGEIAKPLYNAGIGWLYFTLFGLTAFSLMFIGSIFAVKTHLYEATDNELLLALPIPPKYILASRMIVLVAFNFIFEIIAAIPAIVMWVRVAPFPVASSFSFAAVFLALPFFSMAVSGLLGWLIALFTRKIRGKSFLTVLFYIAFLFLYFFLFSKANTYIQKLVANGKEIAGSLGAVAPLYWLGNSIANPNILQLASSLAVMLIPFFLMYYILSATFINIATANRGFAKNKYKHKSMHMSSQSSALLRREMKHFLSSPGYILNAGLGVLFILAAAIALIIKKADLLLFIGQLGLELNEVSTFLTLGICLLASTILFTAPSVSLEGKTLWILKSLPVRTKDVLNAKLNLHRCMSLPAVFAVSIVSAVILSVPVRLSLPLIAAPFLFVNLSAQIGLICNINHPNFDWVNETQVVKQSLSVILSMLISGAAVLIPGAVYFLLSRKINTELFLYAYTALLAAASAFCGKWLNTKGAEKFDELA